MNHALDFFRKPFLQKIPNPSITRITSGRSSLEKTRWFDEPTSQAGSPHASFLAGFPPPNKQDTEEFICFCVAGGGANFPLKHTHTPLTRINVESCHLTKGLVYGNSTVFHFANTSEAQGGFRPVFTLWARFLITKSIIFSFECGVSLNVWGLGGLLVVCVFFKTSFGAHKNFSWNQNVQNLFKRCRCPKNQIRHPPVPQGFQGSKLAVKVTPGAFPTTP